jgi:hypothetical protein
MHKSKNHYDQYFFCFEFIFFLFWYAVGKNFVFHFLDKKTEGQILVDMLTCACQVARLLAHGTVGARFGRTRARYCQFSRYL